ncbi:hypothetical protein F5Y06DRAFT_254750 [Hypoxylon sp. FL0890]|nr:hypothetical protein F5Y06DRAFT_254750 [Hypoxylon sp. FL0890]
MVFVPLVVSTLSPLSCELKLVELNLSVGMFDRGSVVLGSCYKSFVGLRLQLGLLCSEAHTHTPTVTYLLIIIYNSTSSRTVYAS